MLAQEISSRRRSVLAQVRNGLREISTLEDSHIRHEVGCGAGAPKRKIRKTNIERYVLLVRAVHLWSVTWRILCPQRIPPIQKTTKDK